MKIQGVTVGRSRIEAYILLISFTYTYKDTLIEIVVDDPWYS